MRGDIMPDQRSNGTVLGKFSRSDYIAAFGQRADPRQIAIVHWRRYRLNRAFGLVSAWVKVVWADHYPGERRSTMLTVGVSRRIYSSETERAGRKHAGAKAQYAQLLAEFVPVAIKSESENERAEVITGLMDVEKLSTA